MKNFIGVFQSAFDRLMGTKGSTVRIGAGTITGSFNTIYVAAASTITAVVGGGQSSPTWVGVIPAGTTLTVAAGHPVTSITISGGTIVAYS
jgi:hypothetical protein